MDLSGNAWILVEGNYFDNVDQPITSGTFTGGAKVYHIQTVQDASNAQSALGYIPEWNRSGGKTGAVNALVNRDALNKLGQYKSQITWAHWKVENVPTNVKNIAGVGKIGN